MCNSWLRNIRFKRSEAYANFAKLEAKEKVAKLLTQTLRGLRELFEASTLMSLKFVVAKHSSRTLRGVRELCEALNSNKKFRSVQFETLRVYVINANFSALNFTSVNVAKLSSQTLRVLR